MLPLSGESNINRHFGSIQTGRSLVDLHRHAVHTAVLAERERCAKMAEEDPVAGKTIAREIRKDPAA